MGREPLSYGLDGHVAVVTGATGGIGSAIAAELSRHGARVAGLDLARSPGAPWLTVECDVSDEDQVDDAFRLIEREMDTPTVLVCCAGIFPAGPFEELTLQDWSRVLSVNLTSGFLCARRALAGMRSRGFGRIVFIGSGAGKGALVSKAAAYAASKGGLMSLARALAREYATEHITVNALAPAFIETSMIGHIDDLKSIVPVGRLGKPEEVAAVTAFLCSVDAGYITGEVVDINGGFFID
jgi:NAD(P)-dependent dehydrogenase (short-subunit alcohol dehydrogenase family)